MKIKYKWFAPFMFWLPYVGNIALTEKNGWTTDVATRVMQTVGVLIITVVLLALIQPWRPDEPKPPRG